MNETCQHVKEIRKVKSSAKGCDECLKMGEEWLCQSSKNSMTEAGA